MTKEMFETITKWQRETFKEATALSAANHLREEVDELIHDLESKGFYRIQEYADCFLLLFGSAALDGITYEMICMAINDKMEINKKRTWGNANEKGYVKHVTFKPGDIVYLKEDSKKERYTVKKYTKEISRGPMGQFDPSPVVSVTDSLSRSWQFREDSLQLLTPDNEQKTK